MIPWQWRARITKGLYAQLRYSRTDRTVVRIRFDGNGRAYYRQHGGIWWLDESHAEYWMPLNFSTSDLIRVNYSDGGYRYIRLPLERVLQ